MIFKEKPVVRQEVLDHLNKHISGQFVGLSTNNTEAVRGAEIIKKDGNHYIASVYNANGFTIGCVEFDYPQQCDSEGGMGEKDSTD